MKTTCIFGLWAAAAMLLTTAKSTAQGPTTSYNPFVKQGIISPAPLQPVEFNGVGTAAFIVGNTGSTAINPTPGDLMTIIITLSKGVPNNVDPIAAISGPGKARFTWTYDSSNRTYTGTQTGVFPALSEEAINIAYRVEENSFLSAAPTISNGFNANLQPPAFTNPQATDDDAVSSYTYVEAFDYGDAPASYGSARHAIDLTKDLDNDTYNRFIYLGGVVDPETSAQPDASATGDDANQSGGLAVDDEDGVLFPVMSPGQTVNVPVQVTIQPGAVFTPRLNAWIDWNRNGTFEQAERVASNVIVTTSGVVNVPVAVPLAALSGTAYFSRFRVGPSFAITGGGELLASTADAAFGEVEDHRFMVGDSIADLAVTKTVSDTTPYFGDTINFTVTASNLGPSNATGVTVTELLSSGFRLISATPSVGSYNPVNGLWTIGNLAASTSATLSLSVEVLLTGSYVNIVTITGNEDDPDLTNNEDREDPNPQPLADLSIVKSVNNQTPAVGSNVVFTLVATNNGPSGATGVVVNDPLPSGFTFVSANPPAAYNAGTGLWTIGNLASGVSTTLTITATVRSTGTYRNIAIIDGQQDDPDPTNNQDEKTPSPNPQADLAVVKSVNNPTPNVGSNVVFTLVATNNGPSNATGVSVVDQLPSGYTFVSANPAAAYNAVTGVWTIGNLANGASTNLQITATVRATGTYRNTAVIDGDQDDPILPNNQDSEEPTPVPLADLAIVKTVSNATPNVGSNVTFTLLATNNGPSAATGVTVVDQLPSGYTFVSAIATKGAYNLVNGVWTIGGLANGESASLSITATVRATGTYRNTAVIDGEEQDPNPPNNEDFEEPTPVPQADLSIVKTVNNATPAVGSNVVFTLVATNNGPSAATGVTVVDPLPSGYTFVSANPGAGYNAGTGVWTIGSLANGASATLQITATVRATGTYRNTAIIDGNEEDPNPPNNEDNEEPTPSPRADLGIVKTVNNPTPAVGSNVVFTLVATNSGPSAATGVTVVDQLPSGYTFVSANPAAAYNAGTGVWTIGSLANGASATLQITATVRATGTYRNTAIIDGNEEDPNPPNNEDNEEPTPSPRADLGIVKTVNNPTPAVGSNVVFTLLASNSGPSTATGVTVFDQLPSGYTFVSSIATKGSYDFSTGVWTIGGLNNGESASLSITATVRATGTYRNTAIIDGNEEDPNPPNNEDNEEPTPSPRADLGIVKTVNNPTPAVGSNVVFTLVATNSGPSAATGVTVVDQLPSGYTFVSANPAAAYNVGTGVWTIGSLANGASATLQITATVRATGTYRNTAIIDGNEEDPNPPNNEDNEEPTPSPRADLGIVKTVNNPTPVVGTNVVFTLVATNSGPSAATGVTVVDQLPSGYTFVSANPAAAYNAGTGVWTIGSLANGASATLQITATVRATGTYRNTAIIDGNEEDPNPPNNEDNEEPTPSPRADLGIVKTVNNPTPAVGSNVVFTLVATNSGPSAATGVTVVDQLPSGYTFVSANPAAAYNAGTGIWTIGSLANGASATLQITATVRATGTYRNTAIIDGNEEDPNPPNNEDNEEPTPSPRADLAIVKTVNNPTPNVGSNVVFNLLATNNGPSAATGVTVVDMLPSGYTFVSSIATKGSYNLTNGVWTIGSLANGESASLSITATVRATGTYRNTAVIDGEQEDPNPPNNQDEEEPNPSGLGSISGFVFVGSDPLGGVTLNLLNGSGQPVLDDQNVPITTTTLPDGSYSFPNRPPGDYRVSIETPPGYENAGDSDGGDLEVVGDVTRITVTSGNDSPNNNFILSLNCPDDWAEFKSQYLQVYPTETDVAAANPDLDDHDNLVEFAFALKPGSGAGDPYFIRPSTQFPDTLEAVFTRPKGAPDNVVYILEYAPTIGSPTVWQSLVILPSMYTAVDNGDCTETITIRDLETLTGLTDGEGVIRIRVELDEENDNVVDEISWTGVEGWKVTPFGICCQTYSTPYLRSTVFTGTVDAGGVSGQNLTLTTSAGPVDLATLLAAGVPYYLEVTSGDNEGHRFDVASATGNVLTLATDSDIYSFAGPHSTLAGALPASLAGDSVVIRSHWTLNQLFPPTSFGAATTYANADKVQFFSGGQWINFWLYDDAGTPRWVSADDSTLLDQGGLVVPPGRGLFFNNASAATDLLAYGEVRENDFRLPLVNGTSLVGGGYPIDQSANGVNSRQMNLANAFFGSLDFKTADSFYVWNGDATPGLGTYDTYYFVNGAPAAPALLRWAKVGDGSLSARDSAVLLLENRAVFNRAAAAIPGYRYNAPWTAFAP